MAPSRPAYDTTRGVVEVRPLRFTDILDGSFAVFRAGLRPMVALVLAVMVPLQLVTAFVQREALVLGVSGILDDPTGAQILLGEGGVTGATVLSLVVQFVVTPVLAGALAHAAGQVASGRPADLRRSTGVAVRRAGWLVGAAVGFLIARGLLLGFAVLAGVAGVAPLVAVFIVLGVIAAIGLTPLVAVVTPAVVREDGSGADAIRHGITLARRAYWRTAGVVVGTSFVFNLIAVLLAGIPNAIGIIGGLGFAWVLIAAANVLSQLIVVPLTAAAMVLLHSDLRIRQEGHDFDVILDQMRAAAGARP